MLDLHLAVLRALRDEPRNTYAIADAADMPVTYARDALNALKREQMVRNIRWAGPFADLWSLTGTGHQALREHDQARLIW